MKCSAQSDEKLDMKLLQINDTVIFVNFHIYLTHVCFNLLLCLLQTIVVTSLLHSLSEEI
jgi:hypothetical protein